jgi:hypothetical protein
VWMNCDSSVFTTSRALLILDHKISVGAGVPEFRVLG